MVTIIKGLQQQRVYKSVLVQTEVKTMQWKSKQIVHHHSATNKQNNFGLAIFSICFFAFSFGYIYKFLIWLLFVGCVL